MQENQTIQTKNQPSRGFVKLLLLGLVIGLASITPGLSGGVLAIAFGLYAPALDALVNIRAHFKKSVLFLMPLGIGAAAGVLIFGIIMSPLLERYTTSIIYLFMGMVLGSLPSFLKHSTEGGFRPSYLIPFAAAFGIGTLISLGLDQSGYSAELTMPTLLASGAVLALGMVVPGISSSFILLQMGVYDKIINAFLRIDIYSVILITLGFIITGVLTVKIINLAFKRFSGYAHFAALGFLAASVIAVSPGLRGGISLVIDFSLLVCGAVSVYLFMRLSPKR